MIRHGKSGRPPASFVILHSFLDREEEKFTKQKKEKN